MPKYRVSFHGWYIIDADTAEDAIGTDIEDFGVEYAEYENTDVEELRNGYEN